MVIYGFWQYAGKLVRVQTCMNSDSNINVNNFGNPFEYLAMGSGKPPDGASTSTTTARRRKTSTSSVKSIRSTKSNDSWSSDHVHQSKKAKKQNAEQPQSSSNNIFNVLDTDVEMPETSQPQTAKEPEKQPQKRSKFPPLVVFNTAISKIYDILNVIIPDKKRTSVQLTSHGTKVFVDNIDDYKKLRKFLQESKINYFGHPLEEEALKKFVIYGLHEDTPEEDIREALLVFGIDPIKIANLDIKKKRYDGHATYQLQFRQVQNVTLESLQQVRSIGYLKVRFQEYVGRNTPNVCAKCLYPGHGSDFCGMSPRCIRCGDNHESQKCPLRVDQQDPHSRIPAEKVKCANCGGPHTANYKGCPSLKEYMDIQDRVRKRNALRKPRPSTQYTPTTSTHTKPAHSFTQSTTHQSASQGNRLYSHVAASSSPGLLSVDEARRLFLDLYKRLARCSNREEQGMVILEYTMSLLSNHGSR